MTHEMSDSDKTLKNLNECRKQKVEVLPPDVNSSCSEFTVVDGKIRYGLSAVKGIGEKAVLSIIAERGEDGPFLDLEDFVTRVDLRAVNKRVIEGLIKCGAFDFANVSRAEMIDRVDEVVRAGQALQREKDTNQMALFSSDTAGIGTIARRSSNRADWPMNLKLAYERESLGFYISGHPLTQYQKVLRKLGAITTDEMGTVKDKAVIRIGGVITALRLKNTRKGDRYATFLLEDWLGSIESIVWPKTYQQIAHLIVADDPVLVTGRVDVSDERINFIVENMESLIDHRDKSASQGVLRIGDNDPFEEKLDPLVGLLKEHEGRCPVKVEMHFGDEIVSVILRDGEETPVCVDPSESLCEKVEQLFGRPGVLSFQ